MCAHIVNYSSFIKRAITMLYSLSVDVFNERSTKSLYQGKLCIDPPPPPPFFFPSFLLSFHSRRGERHVYRASTATVKWKRSTFVRAPFFVFSFDNQFRERIESSSNTHRSLYPLITTKNRRIRESLIFLPK